MIKVTSFGAVWLIKFEFRRAVIQVMTAFLGRLTYFSRNR